MPWKGILASGVWGLGKGLVMGRFASAPALGSSLHAVFVAPVLEEVLFRHLPLKMSPGAPLGATAIPFGLAHFVGGAGAGFNLFKIADATVGGYLYEKSYRKHGLAAPMTAHFAHNLGAVVGQLLTAAAASRAFGGTERGLTPRDRLDRRVAQSRRLPRKLRQSVVNRSSRVR